MACHLRRIAPMLCATLAMTMCIVATASTPPITNAQGLLAGANGMTLYTYATDGSTGVSHCEGVCAALWPPYLADPGAQPAAGFGLVTRPDHASQWSYHGQPLYRYLRDTKPGNTLGDGINGVWHVVLVH